MNPFDLPGPQFLLLYIVLAIAVTYGLRRKRRDQELSSATIPRLEDPYQLAMLRGGVREAVGLVMLTLLDRKLIVVDANDGLMRAEGVTPAHAQHPFEKAAIEFLATPGSVDTVASSLHLHPAVAAYGETLERNGLLPGPMQKLQRFRLWAAGFGLLLVVAIIKIGIGLSRQRPVSFLVITCALFAGLTIAVCFPRLTAMGDHVLAHTKELFSSLRQRSYGFEAGKDTSDLMWFGAVFGLAAIPSGIMPTALRRFQRPEQTFDGSSSDGSTSSSGSSCGGGCGGGCGGCGG